MGELRKTPMTAGILILNILAFLAAEFTGGSENIAHMLDIGACYAPKVVQDQEYYRLFTSMFLHFGMAHLANNMLVLFVLGGRLETVAGKIRFLLIYLLGGMCGGLFSIFMEWNGEHYAVSAGASGAVFAILGALVFLILINKGHLQDLSIRQIMIIAFLSLYLGFTGSGVDNMAHVGGMIGGFLIALLLYFPRWIRKVLP